MTKSVRKAKRAGAPLGETPGRLESKPLRFEEEREGSLRRRDASKTALSGERAREVLKAQESKRPRSELILRVASKGSGFFGGTKPSGRRAKAVAGLGEKRGGGKKKRKLFFDH